MVGQGSFQSEGDRDQGRPGEREGAGGRDGCGGGEGQALRAELLESKAGWGRKHRGAGAAAAQALTSEGKILLKGVPVSV